MCPSVHVRVRVSACLLRQDVKRWRCVFSVEFLKGRKVVSLV